MSLEISTPLSVSSGSTDTQLPLLGDLELPQNYSILINKLQQFALGLDSAFTNLSIERNELEIDVTNDLDMAHEELLALGAPVAAGRAPPPHHGHNHGMGSGEGEVEIEHVVSDIWIGVILTLLIVSVIFFICSCFLYHKFQQWKNSYRTNRNEPVEICRHYVPDFEAESLPSYTIVSGLPTYDDALEEFRKAGIILTPSMIPVIKIFESDSKNGQIYNLGQALNGDLVGNGGDNISLSSTCTCGANATNYSNILTPNNSTTSLYGTNSTLNIPQVIELTPEQLATLSQKRLSMQITFNQSVRRHSRPRIDLRNNLLRARVAGTEGGTTLPQVHQRRSSSVSLAQHEQNLLECRLQHLHHRGSVC